MNRRVFVGINIHADASPRKTLHRFRKVWHRGAALISSIQRGAALAERDRLQLGKFVAEFGVAAEDWELVADRLQQRLVETGRWRVKQARYYWL